MTGREHWRAALAVLAIAACSGSDPPAGTIEGERRPEARRSAAERAQRLARGALAQRSQAAADPRKQILFGDLHVHTSYSIDAFLYGLPLFGGEGAHPPADACDFARYCSELDFFSLNDHAEALTVPRWRRSLESLRECNARAGDPQDPDLVAFVGWEWTQTGATPETHFGHKNVMFPGLADDELPARPISALAGDVKSQARAHHLWLARGAEAVASAVAPQYADFLWWIRALANAPLCEPGVDTRELPADCEESAPDPALLFEKLAQWGFESLVIPHGLTWGIHAPPGATLAAQLDRARSTIQSGSGSSRCTPATARRGDLRARFRTGRCRRSSRHLQRADAGLPALLLAGRRDRTRALRRPQAANCEAGVAAARQLAVAAGRRPHWVLPDAALEDWLDCDQLRGAFKPALSLAPGPERAGRAGARERRRARRGRRRRCASASGLSRRATPTRRARAPATRKCVVAGMTDARGYASERLERWLAPWIRGPQPRTRPRPCRCLRPSRASAGSSTSNAPPASCIPAVWSPCTPSGRDRGAASGTRSVRREVYATSGPRILLWFELLNGPEGLAPMGSSVVQRERPRFEVRAAGSLEEQPGCPASTLEALSAERVSTSCASTSATIQRSSGAALPRSRWCASGRARTRSTPPTSRR